MSSNLIGYIKSVIMVYRLSDGKKLKKISLGKIDDGVAIRAIALGYVSGFI